MKLSVLAGRGQGEGGLGLGGAWGAHASTVTLMIPTDFLVRVCSSTLPLNAFIKINHKTTGYVHGCGIGMALAPLCKPATEGWAHCTGVAHSTLAARVLISRRVRCLWEARCCRNGPYISYALLKIRPHTALHTAVRLAKDVPMLHVCLAGHRTPDLTAHLAVPPNLDRVVYLAAHPAR